MQEIFEKYCKIIQSNELFEGIDEKNLPAVLEMAAVNALKASGKLIPWQVVTITVEGKIKN